LVGATTVRCAESKPKEWTVLIFMNGKNDLEQFALEDFKELAAVGSTKDVDFVVQMGRPQRRPGGQAALKDLLGGWSGARRFHVAKGTTPAPGQEVEIVGSGPDVDMGAPATLAEFLTWAKPRFPARRYAVIVWNHGQGYRLVMSGEASKPKAEPAVERPEHTALGNSHRAISQDIDTGSIIYNADLRESLAASFGSELRLIGFDACLMAMIETAYELRNQAPVLVASEELEPGNGWDYTSVAKLLTKRPQANESELARDLVASYREVYGDSDSTTLSALNLAEVKPLADSLSNLSDALIAGKERLFPLVKAARAERGTYNEARNPVTIDLIGFLTSLESKLVALESASDVLNRVRLTRDLARKVVFDNYASARRAEPYGSFGLAIYFPASKQAFNRDGWSDGYLRSNKFKQIEFVASERWSAFLQSYLGLPN
jgi:hypothetical protein